ncbi:hypothetical protein DWF00_17765 [Bosea caraganae]|uniref:Lipocalin-like domain-containing protein n=1 Tax=Bosea caraganae TaxID=2763117 RepID=A0A370L7M1_9HYPH|nr:hypothetical protein [Bosea caraganae]RDJ25049.1 hypothetical protein DWF00_17765 [Bosea caraganae]RDJ26159.1 hypothetical protein DWE98_09985 [Bosea caraganae]
MARSSNLTGVWHGLYTYQAAREPIYFMATLIESGAWLTGSTHESEVGLSGAPLTLFAMLEGTRDEASVRFTKTYDGTGGWSHSVVYDGALSADATEIEGRWTIRREASGRFLMIRSAGANESVVRRAFAKV